MRKKLQFENRGADASSPFIVVSAPCRIDMGGTLDISTFAYPLNHLHPCTFNLALDLRTQVRLHPYHKDRVKISSKGFDSAEYPVNEAPFDHPLGLMFAIATHFQAGGIHIDIVSSSPPRSALGGSSSAAVALVTALWMGLGKKILSNALRKKIALLAYAIEGSVAGVPCGLQDQLAAVYGGIHAWYWRGRMNGPVFKKKIIIKKSLHKSFEKNILLAYCGVPHESKDINSKWIKGFVSGKERSKWFDIVTCTNNFVEALRTGNIRDAVTAVNKEAALRREMTPDVFDDIGKQLVESAKNNSCGARFTGAGGGGCIWAIGEAENISQLKKTWENDLKHRDTAHLIDVKIDSKGLMIHRP